MAINRVVIGTRVLIDLNDATVTVNDLPLGVVAYDKHGERIVGVANYATQASLDALTTRVSTLENAPKGYTAVAETKATITSGTQYQTTIANYSSTNSFVEAYINGLKLATSEYSITSAGVFKLANTLTGSNNEVIIAHFKKG